MKRILAILALFGAHSAAAMCPEASVATLTCGSSEVGLLDPGTIVFGRENRLIALDTEREELDVLEDTETYLSGAFGEYRRTLEARLHVTETAGQSDVLEEAQLALENDGNAGHVGKFVDILLPPRLRKIDNPIRTKAGDDPPAPAGFANLAMGRQRRFCRICRC